MNILLAGSRSNENSSKLLLDLITPKYYIDKLYLSEQVERAKEQLINHMRRKTYTCVLLFAMNETSELEGQVTLETVAEQDGTIYRTNYEYDKLYEFLTQRHMNVTKSEKAEQGAANELYYEALQTIYENTQSTKCVLINVPEVAQIDVMKLAYNIIKYLDTPLKVL
ncbi:MAG: hypothetical protein Q4F05_19620 [bacterium]|nr:hypothetical protein [bacterium]